MNKWKELFQVYQGPILFGTAMWWSLGAFVSLLFQFCDVGARHPCVYKSIGAFLNPGYVIACELYRERFEVGK